MAKKLAKVFSDILEYPSAGNDNYKLFFKTTQDECLIMLMTEVMFEFIKLGHKQPHFILSSDVGDNAIKYIRRAMLSSLCTVSIINTVDNFTIDIKQLGQRIRDNTCLIIVPAVARSGIINDIKKVSQLARYKKIPLVCTLDNIFPFAEIAILQTGIDIFLYNTDFSRSPLIFPQYEQNITQPFCIMGVRGEILAGYKLDDITDASYFSSSVLKNIVDSLTPLSAVNVKKYSAIKNKLLSIFPGASDHETVYGVIYVGEVGERIQNTDHIVKYELGRGYVVLFSIETSDKEIDVVKQSVLRK